MPKEYTDASLDTRGAHDYFAAKMAFTTGPAELQRAIDDDEVNVIDVRAAKDYAEGHIPGSVSLPRPDWDDTSVLSADKPNVLILFTDEQRFDTINALGHRHMIHLMARPTHTLAKIDILAVHEKTRVESANFFEQ